MTVKQPVSWGNQSVQLTFFLTPQLCGLFVFTYYSFSKIFMKRQRTHAQHYIAACSSQQFGGSAGYMRTTVDDAQALLCNKKLLTIVPCNLSLTHPQVCMVFQFLPQGHFKDRTHKTSLGKMDGLLNLLRQNSTIKMEIFIWPPV